MPFGWTRTQFGLVYFSDTTQDGTLGVKAAQSKIDADCGSAAAGTATAQEATYETDKTSLTGADANLKMVIADPRIVLTGGNGGV